MQLRGLLIGAVLLAALAGGVYWSNKQKKDEETKPPKDAPPKILSIPEADITQVEFEKPGQEKTVLQREGGIQWKITAPQALRADSESVGPVINVLSSLNSESLVQEKTTDWKTYGLDAPSLTVTIRKKDGKAVKLLVGADTPVGGGMYVRTDGDDRLFTVGAYNRSSFDKSWKDLRDKRLLPVDADKLSRIELTAGKSTVEFGKNQAGEWQLLKPLPFRADNFAVEELLRKLRDAKMDASQSDEDGRKAAKEFAGGTKVAVARLTDASGAKELEIRKVKEFYFAKSNAVDGVWKISSELGTGVDKAADDFRNKKLFEFGFSDPSKLDVKVDGESKACGKNGEKWLCNGREMKAESVNAFIDKIRDLSAVKFDDAAKPVANAEISITVVSNEGKKTEQVLIAGRKGARGAEPAYYELEPAKVDELKLFFASIREPDTVKPPPAPAKK
jgi:hypothetical protein